MSRRVEYPPRVPAVVWDEGLMTTDWSDHDSRRVAVESRDVYPLEKLALRGMKSVIGL
jgi:hypothetical protein